LTLVINFFGGPGSGKSTLATGLFSEMKRANLSVEYVSEYAKDVTWEETNKLLDNQLHIFSEQFRRQWRLKNKVDYIVTDSPLLLSSIYFDYLSNSNQNHSIGFCDSFRSLVENAFLHDFENVNILIERNKDYVSVGRNQTEQQAKEVDNLIVQTLLKHHLFFRSIQCYSNSSPVDILNTLRKRELVSC
jgi:adenylate kinase family enzyme